MFDQLENYPSKGHFFFRASDELGAVCNAPKNGFGVYIVFALKHGKIELIYIGSSGKMRQNGRIQIRKGGMYDTIVNGKQFDKPRTISWKEELIRDNIEALDIYWYETVEENYIDIPASIEGLVMQIHYSIHGRLPKWNKAF